VSEFLNELSILPQGQYLQLAIKLTLLDDAIIRSNYPEEVLSFKYDGLGNRFIIPWRKIKGKLRRMVMEKQRGLGIGKYKIESKNEEDFCHLKERLCMKCPSCFLFGGTGETGIGVKYNILSRVMGETFISSKKIDDTAGIIPLTENAIDEIDLKTGQALMTVNKVPAETEFTGVITIRDCTKEMASVIIDNINRLSRLGARSVEWGKIKTEIAGYILSDRETLSSYYLVKDGLNTDNMSKVSDLQLPDVDASYKKINGDFELLRAKYPELTT
jgi:CRISPR type I-D-associated protein Csc2